MKLNTDCIRSVLINLEKNLNVSTDEDGYIQMEPIRIDDLYENLPEFSKEEIVYAVFNLDQAGYVEATLEWGDDYTLLYGLINYMTYVGHEFLSKIRDDKRWAFVKKGLTSIRDYSLAAISAVAEGVASAAIGKYFEGLGS